MYSALYKHIVNITAKLEVYVNLEPTSLSRFKSMYWQHAIRIVASPNDSKAPTAQLHLDGL